MRTRGLIAAIAAVTIAGLNYGFISPLIGVLMERRGLDNGLIGLSASVQAIAVVIVSPLTGLLLSRLGTPWLLTGALASTACTYLLFAVVDDVAAWFLFRLILGASGAVVWVSSEAWINALAETHNRGRIIGIYSVAAAAGAAIGPLILMLVGTAGWVPFMIPAAVAILGVLVVQFAGVGAPALAGKPSRNPWRLLWIAPLPLLLGAAFSASSESLRTFLAVYGLDRGVAEEDAFALLSAMAIGGILLQYPLGWLADHMSRRWLLVLCVAISTLGFLALPLVIDAGRIGLAVYFCFGGVFFMLYSLALVLLGERFRGPDLVAASASFTMMWGVGTIIGPSLTGVAMDIMGSSGLIWITAGLLVTFLPMALLSRSEGPRAQE
jgi:MFS family permease